MIDVVFLLLIFFMLAARFGTEGAIDLTASGGAGVYEGPPRLVEVTPSALTLNGVAIDDLPTALAPLMSSPSDTVILRARNGADVQRLIDVMETLRAAGFTALVLAE